MYTLSLNYDKWKKKKKKKKKKMKSENELVCQVGKMYTLREEEMLCIVTDLPGPVPLKSP